MMLYCAPEVMPQTKDVAKLVTKDVGNGIFVFIIEQARTEIEDLPGISRDEGFIMK
jgi:hypothetical protein